MNDHERMPLEVAQRTCPPFSVSARTASTIGAIFFQESTGSRKDPFDPITQPFSLLSGTALLLPLLLEASTAGETVETSSDTGRVGVSRDDMGEV